MSQSRILRSLALIGVVALVAIGFALSRRPSPGGTHTGQKAVAAVDASFVPPAIRPAPPNDFVGSKACAACHSDIVREFRSNPMGHSLARVAQATPLETYGEQSRFTVPITSGSTFRLSYSVEKTEEGVVHHESAVGIDGKILYDWSVPVHYAFGSGKRGRSYVINRDGFLFMSALSWYSEGHRWDLSPGYQLHNLHFGRRIVDGCVNCHAGRLDPVGDFPDHFRADPFIEESIGCERCHGPAKGHVTAMEGRDTAETNSLLKLGELTSTQQNHVCFQCHLIGEERIPRLGCTDFDFRPGNHLEDVWTVIVKGTGISDDGTTEAVSQVEQMLSSNCFKGSDRQLKCLSCHGAHSSPSEQDREGFYRARCMTCHGQNVVSCAQPLEQRLAATSVDSCVYCHMPKVAANDVPHTSQTDHRVLRRPNAAVPLPLKKKRPELVVFKDGASNLPQSEIERAQAIAIVKNADGSGNRVAAADAIPPLERWLKVVPNDIAAIESLGQAYYLLQDYVNAANHWERGLELAPKHEHLLWRMFLLCHETQQIEPGIQYGRRLVSVNPWDYEYLGRFAHMLGQSNRLDEASEFGERALQINPSAYHIHDWLARLYSIQGEEGRSQQHRLQFEAFKK
jgi:hypothetical protein